MKIIRISILIFQFSLISHNICTQDLSGSDIYLENNSSTRQLVVHIYPVSMVCNAARQYNLYATQVPENGLYHYNNGRNLNSYSENLVIGTNQVVGVNVDGMTTPGESLASVGRSLYKFEFWWDGACRDTCWVEWDGGTPIDDLSFTFDDSRTPIMFYRWAGCTQRSMLVQGSYLKCWIECDGVTRNRVAIDMTYDNNSSYSLLPQDFRQDCSTENYSPGIATTKRTGLLINNLTISKSGVRTRLVETESERFSAPEQIIVTSGCAMKINQGADYTLKYDPYYLYDNTYYNKLIIQSGALLNLMGQNSNLKVESTNWLNLKYMSQLYLGSGSSITMYDGSLFCNEGASISGPGRIVFIRGIRRLNCVSPGITGIFKDSTKVILDSGAVLEIPDSTTFSFQGKETSLVLNANSVMKFGKNSKLIFSNGAHLFADHSTFCGFNSDDIWDGFFLNDLASDTITNCNFSNSLSGINIINRIYSGKNSVNYSTLIGNCTFSNTTSNVQFTNAIYISNSNNILVCNNTVSSNITQGFVSGITLEYCGSGTINIIDNNISNVSTGLTTIYSSPYIARNRISGNYDIGTGIFLDNSNSIIKYNYVSNFQFSVAGNYSSPYLLKNIFENASSKGIILKTNSIPILRPISSGPTIRWLGGKNTFTGNPSISALWFGTDAYPLMDSGYNVISVNSSDYMQGSIPTSLNRTLYSTMNFWQDIPPSSTKYNVSNGAVTYLPYWDGSSLPNTSGFELNSIGFGMYDTVYYQNSGLDTPGADELFVQGYVLERQQDFTQAINIYKELIVNFGIISYAPIAVARIFSCLDKNKSEQGDFLQIETYYQQIKNNSGYPSQVRETAEDFSIKAKFRAGYMDDAINDYDVMYNLNINTPKGQHALINKECLATLKNDTNGTNFSGNSISQKIALHKRILYSTLFGENIFIKQYIINSPSKFALYQNYPNPFNPETKIKFDVPIPTLVNIQIFDLLGKLVWSYLEYKPIGSYIILFNGSNLASGLYLYKFEADDYIITKKMVLLK